MKLNVQTRFNTYFMKLLHSWKIKGGLGEGILAKPKVLLKSNKGGGGIWRCFSVGERDRTRGISGWSLILDLSCDIDKINKLWFLQDF